MRNADLRRELDSRTRQELESTLRGLTLIYKIPGSSTEPKKYKFNGFKDPPNKLTFRNAEGQSMTIEKYFQTKKYQIQFPYMPCVWIGNTVKTIYVPAELCRIAEGQVNSVHFIM